MSSAPCRLGRHHQPPASRMSRWRTRAATSRRYSAVERTSSIGWSSPASVSAARSAVSGVGERPDRTAFGRGGTDRGGRHGPEREPDVRPRRGAAAVPPAEREHDLADRLRASRPDLAEAELPAGHQRDADAQQELVGCQRRPPVGGPERVRGDGPFPTCRADHERGVGGEQDRQRVPGGRGVDDVAAERPAVLDLGRADRRGRLDQPGEMLAADGRAADLRVGRQGTEADRVAIDGDAAQRVEPPQVDDALGRFAQLAGQRDHQVGAAGDRPGGAGGEDRVRVGEVARARDGRLDRHRRSAADAPAGHAGRDRDERGDDPEPHRQLLGR